MVRRVSVTEVQMFLIPLSLNLFEHAIRLGHAREAVKPPQWGALMKLCKLLFVCTVCLGPGGWGGIRVCDEPVCVDYYLGVCQSSSMDGSPLDQSSAFLVFISCVQAWASSMSS